MKRKGFLCTLASMIVKMKRKTVGGDGLPPNGQLGGGHRCSSTDPRPSIPRQWEVRPRLAALVAVGTALHRVLPQIPECAIEDKDLQPVDRPEVYNGFIST